MDQKTKHEKAVRLLSALRRVNEMSLHYPGDHRPGLDIPTSDDVFAGCLGVVRACYQYPDFQWTEEMEKEYQEETKNMEQEMNNFRASLPGFFHPDGTFDFYSIINRRKSLNTDDDDFAIKGEDDETEI